MLEWPGSLDSLQGRLRQTDRVANTRWQRLLRAQYHHFTGCPTSCGYYDKNLLSCLVWRMAARRWLASSGCHAASDPAVDKALPLRVLCYKSVSSVQCTDPFIPVPTEPGVIFLVCLESDVETTCIWWSLMLRLFWSALLSLKQSCSKC